MSAERQNRRTGLRDLNEKMRLNGMDEVSMSDYKNLDLFKTAYLMEIERRKKRTIKELLISVVITLSIIASYLNDLHEILFELFKKLFD